jgi:hypothetical protein
VHIAKDGLKTKCGLALGCQPGILLYENIKASWNQFASDIQADLKQGYCQRRGCFGNCSTAMAWANAVNEREDITRIEPDGRIIVSG